MSIITSKRNIDPNKDRTLSKNVKIHVYIVLVIFTHTKFTYIRYTMRYINTLMT